MQWFNLASATIAVVGNKRKKKEKTETEKKNGFYSLHDGEAKKKDLFFLFLIKPSLKIGVKCRQSRSNEERRTAFVFQSLFFGTDVSWFKKLPAV